MQVRLSRWVTTPQIKILKCSALARSLKREDGALSRHFNEDLYATTNMSECPMYFTPPKYWPNDLTEKYIGNRNVFGMLRDRYERLVAFLCGNYSDYGGSYAEEMKTCDVTSGEENDADVHFSWRYVFRQMRFRPTGRVFQGEIWHTASS